MKTKLSFQELLDKTNRNQYTDKDVVALVEPCEPQELEFFTLGRNVSDDDLQKEYASRGLEPASPYALALYDLEHPDVMEDKKYVGTHWKDAKGKWCFATFDRWRGGRRVDVYRDYGFDWDDRWSFAGLRKSSDLKSISPSVPLTLGDHPDIEVVESLVTKIRYQNRIYKLDESEI